MPRHQSLNLKKFIDSISESLVEEYFKQKIEDGESLPLTAFDYESVNASLDAIQDEELRGSILEEFTHINDICEKTMNILVRAIHRCDIQTTSDEERQELAMDVFLHHKRAFNYTVSEPSCGFEVRMVAGGISWHIQSDQRKRSFG